MMTYTSEENLIIQSTCNAVLLSSLSIKGEEFLNSEFFKRLDFIFPNVKTMYTERKTHIGNQGMLLVCLYALLVLPKERILKKYSDSYKNVNEWIDNNKESCKDTYSYQDKNREDLKHITHIRNAVSHGNVEFDDTDSSNVICEFKDVLKFKAQTMEYSLKLTIENVGNLVVELVKVQQNYVNDIVKRQQK